VIPEVVRQICFQIIGNDVTITMASEASELEFNMAEPVAAFNLLFGFPLQGGNESGMEIDYSSALALSRANAAIRVS
jgi:fumarate hydratase class II